mmetsp:Transcript_119486/g.178524  ORF Transcript_119486/g.178524 Transcript_119486/m.178524 type:complete len:222 (-) Transcript_119486:111-776(-)
MKRFPSCIRIVAVANEVFVGIRAAGSHFDDFEIEQGQPLIDTWQLVQQDNRGMLIRNPQAIFHLDHGIDRVRIRGYGLPHAIEFFATDNDAHVCLFIVFVLNDLKKLVLDFIVHRIQYEVFKYLIRFNTGILYQVVVFRHLRPNPTVQGVAFGRIVTSHGVLLEELLYRRFGCFMGTGEDDQTALIAGVFVVVFPSHRTRGEERAAKDKKQERDEPSMQRP